MTEDSLGLRAYVKHQVPGRTRLHIPQKRGDGRYFERLADALAACPGVGRLRANAAAASILVCHPGQADFQVVADYARAAGLFDVDGDADGDAGGAVGGREDGRPGLPALPLTGLAALAMRQLDGRLLALSAGRVDGRSLLFVALLGLAARQLSRGMVWVPATSLLWYALTLLKEADTNADVAMDWDGD